MPLHFPPILLYSKTRLLPLLLGLSVIPRASAHSISVLQMGVGETRQFCAHIHEVAGNRIQIFLIRTVRLQSISSVLLPFLESMNAQIRFLHFVANNVHFRVPTETSSSLLKTGAYILVGVGAVTMLMGFLGCIGAVNEIRCLLGLVSIAKRYHLK